MKASEFLDRLQYVGSSKSTIGKDSEISVVLDRFEKVINNAVQKNIESTEDISVIFEEHKQALQNVYEALQAVKTNKSEDTISRLVQELERTNKVDSISRKLLMGHPQQDYKIMSENLEASKYLKDNRSELMSVLEKYNATQTRSLESIRETLRLIESEALKNNKLPLQYSQLGRLENKFVETKGTSLVRSANSSFDEVYNNISSPVQRNSLSEVKEAIANLASLYREENDRRNYNRFGADIHSNGSFRDRALEGATIALGRAQEYERISMRNLSPYEIDDAQVVNGEESNSEREVRRVKESKKESVNRSRNSADSVEDRDAVNADSRKELEQLSDSRLGDDVHAIREILEDLVRLLSEETKEEANANDDENETTSSGDSGSLSRLKDSMGGIAEGIGSIIGGVFAGKGLKSLFSLGGRRSKGKSIGKLLKLGKGLKGGIMLSALTAGAAYLMSDEGQEKIKNSRVKGIREALEGATSEEDMLERLQTLTPEEYDAFSREGESEADSAQQTASMEYNLTPEMQSLQERQRAYQEKEKGKTMSLGSPSAAQAGIGGTAWKYGWRAFNALLMTDYVRERFPEESEAILNFVTDPTGSKKKLEEARGKKKEMESNLNSMTSDPVVAQALIDKLGITEEEIKAIEESPVRINDNTLLTNVILNKLLPKDSGRTESWLIEKGIDSVNATGIFSKSFQDKLTALKGKYGITNTGTDLVVDPNQAVQVLGSRITETGERGVSAQLYSSEWAKDLRGALQRQGITDEALQNAMLSQLAIESEWGKDGTQAKATNNWTNMGLLKSWKGPVTTARDKDLAGKSYVLNRPVFKDNDEFASYYMKFLKSYGFTGNETPDEFFAMLDGENAKGKRWAVGGNYRQALFNTMYSQNAPEVDVYMKQGDKAFTGDQLAEAQGLWKERRGGTAKEGETLTENVNSAMKKLQDLDKRQRRIDSSFLAGKDLWKDGKWNEVQGVNTKFYTGDVLNTNIDPNLFVMEGIANKVDSSGNVSSIYVDSVSGELIKGSDLLGRDPSTLRKVSVGSSEYKQLVYDFLKNKEGYYKQEVGDSEAVTNLKALANSTRQAILQRPNAKTAYALGQGVAAFSNQKVGTIGMTEGEAKINMSNVSPIDPNSIDYGNPLTDIPGDRVRFSLSKGDFVSATGTGNKFIGEDLNNLLGQQYIDAEGQSTFVKFYDKETADIVADRDFLGRKKSESDAETFLKQEDWKRLRERVEAVNGDVYSITEPRYLRGDDPMMEKFTVVDAKRPPMKSMDKKKESPQPKENEKKREQAPVSSYNQVVQTFTAPDNNIQSNFANIGTR